MKTYQLCNPKMDFIGTFQYLLKLNQVNGQYEDLQAPVCFS